jgi:hypothetical protein
MEGAVAPMAGIGAFAESNAFEMPRNAEMTRWRPPQHGLVSNRGRRTFCGMRDRVVCVRRRTAGDCLASGTGFAITGATKCCALRK